MFLADYLIYAKKNEAPIAFHLWCAYIALSAVTQRRVWLRRGNLVTYPGLYVLLVGEAGCGKSTAIAFLNKLLRKLEKRPQISKSVETVEGLIRHMAGNPNAEKPIVSPCFKVMTWPDGQERPTHSILIVANEFIDFIRVSPENWTSFLNNVYDQDTYEYRTKNSGDDELIGPYVTLIGGIPTEINKRLQVSQVIDSGFSRRTIMQFGVRQYDNPHAEADIDAEQTAALARCVDWLNHLTTITGEVKRTPDAQEWWLSWYDNHSRTLLARATPITKPWLNSKPEQVLKLGLLNCLARTTDKIMTVEDLQTGLADIEFMEQGLPMIFGNTGRNELAGVLPKVYEYISQCPNPRTFNQLQVHFFNQLKSGAQIQELTDILNQLVAEERIMTSSAKTSAGIQNIYATPATMSAFLARATAAQPSDAAQTGTAPGAVV